MDGKVYSYATPGNMWNSYESFQPPSLDLQSYIPSSRETFQREPAKNPFLAASSYMFFNYPDESGSHHHQQPPDDCANQWQSSTFSKLRPKASGLAHDQNVRGMDKSFSDAHSLGTELIHADAAGLSLPEPVTSGVCTDRTGVVPMDSVVSNIQHNCPNTLSGGELRHVEDKTSTSTKRKNSGLPKKREKCTETLALKKRARDEESWARNVRKIARSKGESYVSVQGKVVPARSVKPVDCSNCKFNCPSRITEEERQHLFSKYWALETFKEKVDYISSCIHEFAPLRPVSGRRAFSRRYTMKIHDREERVCKEFFVTTFDISESTVVTYMDKKRKGPDAIKDLRGKQTPSNKTPDVTVKCIREHILSQIGLQGELTRSPRDDVQNVKKLYRHYQSECETDNMKPASISVYRKVYAEMHKAPVELPPKDILSPHSQAQTQVNKDCQTAFTSINDSAGVCAVGTASQQHDQNRCSATTIGTLGNLEVVSHSYQCNQQTIPSQLGNLEQTASLHVSNTYHPLQGQHAHHYQLYDHQHQHYDLHNNQNNAKLLQSKALQNNFFSMSSERHAPMENICTYAWDPTKITPMTCEASVNCCSPLTSTLQSCIPMSVSLSSSSSLNNKVNSSNAAPNLAADADNQTVNTPALLLGKNSLEAKKNDKRASPNKVTKEAKCKAGQKKRCRNEDSWGRNVRKRLRFKGEAYTSVRGKPVEAKRVKKVDCSKCKFKCTSRITEEQRETLNLEYWSLDTYQKKIEYLTNFVETYTPKRKMTGRRAFSRKYTFEVEGNEERVCKDFFKTTLHISESTIATALEKSRKGPDAIADMRGKHKPVNKTTEETMQNIRELIIYMTGLRPHRANTSSGGSCPGYECKDVQRLYHVYKYDCERKSKKFASLGIFRKVFMKEFQVKALLKSKKEKRSDRDTLKTCSSGSVLHSYETIQLELTGSVPTVTWQSRVLPNFID